MNWDNLGRYLLQLLVNNSSRLLQAAMILCVAWVGLLVVRVLLKRFQARIERTASPATNPARKNTLLMVLSSTITAVILGTALFSLLALMGINITPVLASVGVIGLAVSLGAQALIKDYIGGFYILFEDQYTIGDEVLIGAVRGTVERMSMRATWVREFSGRLFTIPNAEVRSIANLSRAWMRGLVDLTFAYQEDLRRVIEVLQRACEQAAQDEDIKDDLMEPPVVAGWSGISDWGVRVRLVARTRPGRQYAAEMALRRYALDALNAAGIAPVTPVTPLMQS